MEITLTAAQQSFIERQVEEGRFATPEEAVSVAVTLLEAQERADDLSGWDVEELRREIQLGIDSLDRGEGRILACASDWENLASDIKARGRARLAEKQAATRQ